MRNVKGVLRECCSMSQITLTLLDFETCGQSYNHVTLVNYDSRVVITSKLLILMTLES